MIDIPRPPRYRLGGAGPSQVIRPRQWLGEIERLAPSIGLTPAELAPAACHARWLALDRLPACLSELAKFDLEDERVRLT